MIVFWDMYELMSSGSVSTNDYQVRKLAYSAKGDYLAAIFFDEIKKKWQTELFSTKTRQMICHPMISEQPRSSIAWHPRLELLAVGGEARAESSLQSG